jgi:hypothetical protein
MCKTLFFFSSLTVCSSLVFENAELPSLSQAEKISLPSFFPFFFSSFGHRSRIVRDLFLANRNRGPASVSFGSRVGPPHRRDHPTLYPPSGSIIDLLEVQLCLNRVNPQMHPIRRIQHPPRLLRGRIFFLLPIHEDPCLELQRVDSCLCNS